MCTDKASPHRLPPEPTRSIGNLCSARPEHGYEHDERPNRVLLARRQALRLLLAAVRHDERGFLPRIAPVPRLWGWHETRLDLVNRRRRNLVGTDSAKLGTSSYPSA